MVFLNATNNIGPGLSNAITSAGNAVNIAANALSSFVNPNSNTQGLPSSQVPFLQPGISARNIMHWFVPEVGVVEMYINPQQVSYTEKKLITSIRTKGGYTMQYWGEELSNISLSGNTGSAGAEGLNVLEEIYRAEQLMFDPIALTMISNNSISGLNGLVNNVLGNLGGLGTTLSNATQGIMAVDPLSQSILPQNTPTLASMALGVELYYAGKIYRGYFNDFKYDESAERIGIFNYNISFTVTQTRGYRLNNFAWQRSADSGPSNNSPGGVPLSFSGLE